MVRCMARNAEDDAMTIAAALRKATIDPVYAVDLERALRVAACDTIGTRAYRTMLGIIDATSHVRHVLWGSQ